MSIPDTCGHSHSEPQLPKNQANVTASFQRSISQEASTTTIAEIATAVATPAQILPNMCKPALSELPHGQIVFEPLPNSVEEEPSPKPQDEIPPEAET